MRSSLAVIFVLSSCLLAGRALWSLDGPATTPAASRPNVGVASMPAETDSNVVGRQRFDGPFAATPSPAATAATLPARLPPVAADLSHVREFPFDAASLERLASGDSVRIDFPPLGGRYELSVDEVLESSDRRTIRGHIDYDRRQYPSLITLTDGWSFGNFTTPEGNFEFTARDGMARMVDGAELERRAYVPNHTLIPDRS